MYIDLLINFLVNLRFYQKCFLISGFLFSLSSFFANQIAEFSITFIILFLLAGFTIIVYVFSLVYVIVNMSFPRSKEERKQNIYILSILLIINIIALTPQDIFKSEVMLSVYEEPRGISGSFGINFRKDGTFELHDTILGVGDTFEGRYTIENEVITLLDEYPKIPKYFKIRGNELIYLDNNKKFDEESYRYFRVEENLLDK